MISDLKIKDAFSQRALVRLEVHGSNRSLRGGLKMLILGGISLSIPLPSQSNDKAADKDGMPSQQDRRGLLARND
jgi:hypothetical protein